MNEIVPNGNEGWNELRPLIDEALGELGETDREAIVLRYFQSYEFSLIGAALGVKENAARMRVDRALEKLRVVLQKRGLAATGAGLGAALADTSGSVVPVHLAAHITSADLAQTATTSASSTTSILKLLLMKKIVLVTAGALGVALATVVAVKTLTNSPPRTTAAGVDDWLKEEPGVKKFRAAHKFVSVGQNQSLIMGGWPAEAGKHLLVFITPTMIDSAGKRLAPPFSATSQILLDSKFIEAPDQVFADLGLQTLFTEQNDSKEAVQCSDVEFRSYIQAMQQHSGADLLSAPRVTTTLGVEAHLPMQETEMIAGKEHKLGQEVDFLPTLSSDGKSVDILVICLYRTDAPKVGQ
jgi:hypothetical protein